MGGSLDLDSFEQSMAGPVRDFDVLALTPGKMGLLIRRHGDLRYHLSLGGNVTGGNPKGGMS